MKLKMSDKSLFAVLLRSPWWISLLITLAIAGAARAALPTEYWITGAMGATPFFVIAVVAAWKQWQTPSPAATAQTLETATAMPWRDFAQSLEDALRLDGYEVERLGSKNSTNSAADFCLTRHGRTVLMSCKRWKAASHGAAARVTGPAHYEGGPGGVVCGLGQCERSGSSFCPREPASDHPGPRAGPPAAQTLKRRFKTNQRP
jgi:restriction system protein